MIDFFAPQSNSQNMGYTMILYAILLAIILSSTLAITYERTSRETVKKRHFIQAMILIAVVVSVLMQAIGDSLARSLGMLGALSIIRFRNTVDNPRNLVFMFASISIGIACGVYGFLVATLGTLGFVITAAVLYLSPFSRSVNMIGSIVIETAEMDLNELTNLLSRYCKRYHKTRFNYSEDPEKGSVYAHSYQVRLKDNMDARQLLQELQGIESIAVTRFNVKDTTETI